MRVMLDSSYQYILLVKRIQNIFVKILSVQNILHSFPPFPTTSWHAIHKCMIELNFFNVSRRVSYFDVKVFWKYDKIDLLQKVNQSTYCPLSNTLTTAQNIEENLISTLQCYIEMSNGFILVNRLEFRYNTCAFAFIGIPLCYLTYRIEYIEISRTGVWASCIHDWPIWLKTTNYPHKEDQNEEWRLLF